MRIEHVYPDCVTEKIDEIDRHLADIEKEYLAEYLRNPLGFGVCTLEMDYRNDWRVKSLEKQKVYIYERAVCKTILTAETEEEKKMLQERFGKNENNIP